MQIKSNSNKRIQTLQLNRPPQLLAGHAFKHKFLTVTCQLRSTMTSRTQCTILVYLTHSYSNYSIFFFNRENDRSNVFSFLNLRVHERVMQVTCPLDRNKLSREKVSYYKTIIGGHSVP